jgi:hypothetical protein
MPNKCMKLGAECTASTDYDGHVTTHDPSSPTGSDPSSQPGSSTPGGTGPSSGSGDGTTVDPLTGQPEGTSVTADGALATAAGTPVTLAASHRGQQRAVAWLVAAMLALTVLAPPFLIARHGRRR